MVSVMTSASDPSGTPRHRKPEASEQDPESPQGDTVAEASLQAAYEETMARFAAMYEEWHTAHCAIRDAPADLIG